MDGQSEAPADLNQDERERDGDAEAPVQDFVEEAVPRVVVLLGVSPEPLLLEQELAQAMKAAERVALLNTGGRGQAVESLQVLLDVQVRILSLGDEERREREVNLRLGAPDGSGEFGK